MKIGVLSDTHVSRIGQLPAELVYALREVDLIVHLGDYTGKGLISDLQGLGDFRGVAGNMDPSPVQAELPDLDVLDLNGRKIGLIHGWGPPSGMRERIKEQFKGVDAILYGHTHKPDNEFINGVLFFNPGSASGKYPASHKTYGILIIEESFRGEIVTVG